MSTPKPIKLSRQDPSGPAPQSLAELQRLREDEERNANWKRWGPYLSERQWGTVREDYSADGDCWNYFPHEQARSRAYRWGEDGLMGICDRQCRLCFALSLWNDRDPILKERLFGLTNPQGNHGEDVKESYFYLDSTPTHSYMKGLYQYPQAAFPYDKLVEENARRSRDQPEYELNDTGVFDENRYFDVQVEYAKNTPEDLLIKVTVTNRGPETAAVHVLPTLWFKNSWSWGCKHEGCEVKPRLSRSGPFSVDCDHVTLGRYDFHAEPVGNETQPKLIFTDNESNLVKLFEAENYTPYVKDAFHEYVTRHKTSAINPREFGTKCAAYYLVSLKSGESATFKLRLTQRNGETPPVAPFGAEFEKIFKARVREADAFYDWRIPSYVTGERRNVARQAYAGLLWSKQFYHYVVEDWIDGDPMQPPPPRARRRGRNSDWKHVFNRDVLSMPDKWEYPWFAAWDLAFHMIPMARLDPQFAKDQLILLLREWYMHPNGQLPAYEFAFGDVNPPVHAWAVWRVYKMTAPRGSRDKHFLARAFQKLLLNFTWWVNRKDATGKNVFGGGFLGMDNIGVFDRNTPLPGGAHLEQADGTAWMAFYCATMLSMALELAEDNPEYEDTASKFFEHFVSITDAMNTLGGTGLWDEQDSFYYDQIYTPGDDHAHKLRVRSLVGLLPIIAVEVLEARQLDRLPGFKKRTEWFLKYRKDLARHITYMERCAHDGGSHYLLAIPSKERLAMTLRYMLDENEFLSPFGVRSLSRVHEKHPYTLASDGKTWTVQYTPGDSNTSLFGGNSNWRGPVWFPINFLLIEALERYDLFYRDDFKIEFPTGSGNQMTLKQVAHELAGRMVNLFLPDEHHNRPAHATDGRLAQTDSMQHLVLFHEFFHGDTGTGLGASHQTGWTALVTRLIEFGRPE